MTTKIKTFQGATLYRKNAKGECEQWTIKSNIKGLVTTTYGEFQGKLITTSYQVKEGKNIGKVNETSIAEQAASEAHAKWVKKTKQGYVPSFIDASRGVVDTNVITGGINPMLLHNFKKHKAKIKWPAIAQPKLNGERCIAIKEDGGTFTLWTRTRKPILSCPHIIEDLDFIFAHSQDIILDGELYNHDLNCESIGAGFEKLMSAVRKKSATDASVLAEFHIFDMVNEEPAVKRLDFLLDQKSPGPNRFYYTSVRPVETVMIENEKALEIYHRSNVKRKYEGTVVRNSHSPYEYKRSFNCLKRKDFDDGEFLIKGFKLGKQNTVVAICVDKKGSIFEPTMKGSKEENQKFLKDKSYIGKMLNVQYQGLTGKNKVPLFPVGVRVRE